MPDDRALPVAFRAVSSTELPDLRDGIIDVYRDAFAQPPYHRGEEDLRDFAESFARHATFDGFQAILARSQPGGDVVGFTYGYTLAPGQWWYERVAPLVPAARSISLLGAFLLTQLAVRPGLQGRGIGGRLHDALLAGVPHDRALLSTRQGDSPARHLYERRGWRPLLRDVAFPGAGHPYMVLVRELPRQAAEMPRCSA